MSIVCAARKNGEIAIAADTLTKYGSIEASSRYKKNSSKLFRVNGSVVGLVGWCAISSVLEHLMRRERKLFRFGNRMEILSTLLELHERMKEDYHMRTSDGRGGPVESMQLHGLVINANGMFELDSYREVSEYNRFWAVGSGRRLALGAMHATYTGGRSARAIAEAGVRAAAAFDDGCSLPLRSKVIGLGK